MDVISLSKANKAKRTIQQLDNRLGEGVQDIHPNVKTRLEELEKKDPQVALFNRVSLMESNTAINLNKHNLHVSGLLNKNRYQMTDLITDDFGDDTGIDQTQSTGYAYDATNKKVTIASGETQAEVVTISESLTDVPQMIILSQLSNEQSTATQEENLANGILFNTVFTGDAIQLLTQEDSAFPATGSYETSIIDLGDNFKELKKIERTLNEPEGCAITWLTATSNDGTSFSEYVLLNSDNTIASPSARYVKIKAELMAKKEIKETVVHEFLEEERNAFQENNFLVWDGSVKLKTSYKEEMEIDSSFIETGTLLKRTISKMEFKEITKIEVM